jgi:tetratricopeptide (TPR) repeat protein
MRAPRHTLPQILAADLLVLSVMLMAVGCATKAQDPADREAAYKALDEGLNAFGQRDYATAEPKLTLALEKGALNPDSYGEAAVKRVVCWGAAGRYDEAYTELDRLEAGAPNLDQVAAARSYVLAKQGKAAESRAALAKARQYNRTVQEFKD